MDKAKTRRRTVRREILEAQCLVCGAWKEIDPRAEETFRTCGQSCRVRVHRAGGDFAAARRRYQETQGEAAARPHRQQRTRARKP